jgi:hypothetical protein
MRPLCHALDILNEAMRLARLVGMACSDLEVEDDSASALTIGVAAIIERIITATEIVQTHIDAQSIELRRTRQ